MSQGPMTSPFSVVHDMTRDDGCSLTRAYNPAFVPTTNVRPGARAELKRRKLPDQSVCSPASVVPVSKVRASKGVGFVGNQRGWQCSALTKKADTPWHEELNFAFGHFSVSAPRLVFAAARLLMLCRDAAHDSRPCVNGLSKPRQYTATKHRQKSNCTQRGCIFTQPIHSYDRSLRNVVSFIASVAR